MKERLDVLVCNNNLADSREKAKRIIMAGIVYVDGNKVDKAGTKIDVDSKIEVRGKDIPYVSRGGLKLEKALKVFDINVDDKICLDVGASSGGFSDCLLQNGAKKVYSVDVGYGQLDYKLRNDERIVCLERTNFRNMEFEKVGEKVDIAVMDVSFISVLKLVDNLFNFLKDDFTYICLIKPQFEVGKKDVGNGVIHDKLLHEKVIINISEELNKKGIYINGLDYSPIKGPKGNIEFIAYFGKNETKFDIEKKAKECVNDAHKNLEVK